MTETDFWPRLEFRICHEFSGMSENHLRHRWCDGFLPDEYHLDGPEPSITGRAWICNGQMQENWSFALKISRATMQDGVVDWDSLLPPKDVTKWMLVDIENKHIEIEPAVAVPDLK